MQISRKGFARLTAATVFVAAAAPAADAATPLTYLRSSGGQANVILPLMWGMALISVGVIVVITVLLIYGVWRAHRYSGMAVERGDLQGGGASGLSWIFIGVGVSAVILFAVTAWTMVTIANVGPPFHGKPAFTIEVTGHQWWWQVNYLSDRPSRTFETANEIHIPVGEPIRVELKSDDVIHSFWVPALAGKTDMIPGQTNVTWLEADKPGVYRGQCAEFCGAQHAHMAFVVVASSPADFKAWWNEQLRDAPAPTSAPAVADENAFIQKCGVCHTVLGTPAHGVVGPNLSHLMERRTLAAGVLSNNIGNLAGWISDPQAIKPGSEMPQPELTPAKLQRIVAFLKALK
jgi:cytochrome c oxidase subunit II